MQLQYDSLLVVVIPPPSPWNPPFWGDASRSAPRCPVTGNCVRGDRLLIQNPTCRHNGGRDAILTSYHSLDSSIDLTVRVRVYVCAWLSTRPTVLSPPPRPTPNGQGDGIARLRGTAVSSLSSVKAEEVFRSCSTLHSLAPLLWVWCGGAGMGCGGVCHVEPTPSF